MLNSTPTVDTKLPRRFSDFDTLAEALDYAARGCKGLNFYSGRGELESTLPYRDVREQAISLARRMVSLGLEAGDRIALIADNSADFIVAFMACQYGSLIPVPLPLPTSFGGREGYTHQLHRQMESCGARAAITPAFMRDLLGEAASGILEVFAGSHEELWQLPEGDVDLRRPRGDDICYLQYSSGSTRFPHGVMVTQRSALANCQVMARRGVQLVDDDRATSWLPLYHDMGLVGYLLTPVTNQVSVDFMAAEQFARRPLQWLKLIGRNRGTICYSPSFGYELCTRRANADTVAELDLSSWRLAGIGADMIRADVMRQFAHTFAPSGFRDTSFVACYGLAECTLAVSFAKLDKGIEIDVVDEHALATENVARTIEVDDDAPDKNYRQVVNCGSPLPGFELEIRDSAGAPVEERVVGQIFVRGPSVMSGYFNDPESTARVLSADGWLDTGDMGYRVGDSIYMVGRAKDLIILNGRNHWPQDIEWAAEQLPGLRSGDSAAISLPGNDDEEIATLLVQCRLRDVSERRLLSGNIKRQIQRSIGINCGVVFIPPRSLPRTSSGKLSRSRARASYLSGILEAIDGSDQQPWADEPQIAVGSV